MPAAPMWLCSEMQVVRRNMHLSDAQIAGMLERRSEAGVRSFRLYYGMKRRPRLSKVATAERAKRIVAMFGAGRKITHIAADLGCCTRSVYLALRRAGSIPQKRGAAQ